MSNGITTSVSTTLKTWFARATRSRITMAFFIAMLANYIAQTTLHTIILSYYARNRHFVSSAINAAGVQRGFPLVQGDVMQICSGIPLLRDTSCHTVYNGSAISTPTSSQGAQCAEALIWLENYLVNSKSEEVFYLVLEAWLLVISLIALMDESIPHLIVVLAAQLVNTGWVSYRIARDIVANQTYFEMVVNGSCGGFDILAGSWQYDMFYVTVGCSIAALLIMSLLVFQLIKLYSNGKLSSVGAPPVINRMLKWRLWMRVFLQFTTFFILASAAIWYDKRRSVSSYYFTNILYDVGFYVVAIIILPWLVLGTNSVSKENRLLFFVYAILSIILLVISGLWFASALFRWEYKDWRTFSCATTMADMLLVITSILSVICRLNFGKGLAHFLVVEQNLQDAGFTNDTFFNDQSIPWRPNVGDTQVVASNGLRPLTLLAPKQSQPSPKTSTRPPSVCSVESAVFATWLAHDGDLETCKTLTEEGPSSIIFIPREDMSVCDVQSISDENGSLGTVDEKEGLYLESFGIRTGFPSLRPT